jgi:Flp pilus assembly protein TadB
VSAANLAASLLAAGLAAGGVLLVMPRASGRDLTGVTVSPGAAQVTGSGVPPGEPERDDLIGRHRVMVSMLAGAAPLLLLGGVLGLVAAVVVTGLVWRALGSREPAHERRRREQVARSLPHVVDLLAVALASGSSPTGALSAVAAALDGPVVADLRAAEHGLRLGRDPGRVWRELADRPGLTVLGRAMSRAIESGASVSEALHRLAQDLQAAASLEAESRARAVGVRAAAPLGLCLLPAFVLVGVVPLVAGTVAALLTP